LAGKKVKCQKCQAVFTVPLAEENATLATGHSSGAKPGIDMELESKPRVAPAKTPPKPNDEEPLDGIIVDDDVPAKRSGAKPPPPPLGKMPLAKAPAKARPKPQDSGFSVSMMGLIVVLVGGGLFTCLGCFGALGWWLYTDKQAKPDGVRGPIAAADKIVDANKDRDKKPDDNQDKKNKKGDNDRPPFDDKKKDGPPFDGKKKDGPPFDGFKDKDKKNPPPAGAINVVFGPDGSFTSNNFLHRFDPVDTINKHHKLYNIRMEAGRTYQIDLISNVFDAYLYLYDDANNKITEDDDSGGGLNARIIYRAQRTGLYRIRATYLFRLDDNQNSNFTFIVRRLGGGVGKNPDPVGDVLVGDLATRAILFNKQVGKVLGDLVWARDGKSFYVLHENGLLERINPATGNAEKQHNHARRCGNLALSGEGLLLSVPETQEVWVVDPDNLGTIKKKIAVPSVTRVTAGVNAKIAVAAGTENFGQGGMNVIDLQKGAVVGQYRNLETRHLIASPDGKYVFAQGGIEQLVRFRLDGQQPIKEDSSPRIASNGQSICVSPDSKYVCLPAGGGNGSGHPDHPPTAAYSTYIYPITNLKRPDFAIPSGAYPQAVGFDPKSGLAFAQNFDKALLIYTFAGIKRSEHAFPGIRGGDVREFSVSPLGFEVLLRTDDRVIRVKLKADKVIGKDNPPPIPVVDPKLNDEIGKSVIAATLKLGDFTAKEIALKNSGPGRQLMIDSCWDAQGKSVYWLATGALVYKMSRDGKIEAAAALPKQCHQLALSAEGLLTLPVLGTEVWVLDPHTLAVRSKISCPATTRWIGAAQDSSTAWVRCIDLGFVDLKQGTVRDARLINSPDNLKTARMVALSPDGKFLCAQTNDFQCHRYRVEGDQLTHEASKAPGFRLPILFHFAPDSKQVTMTHPTFRPSDAKKTAPLAVYPIKDWEKPAYSILGAYKLAAIDPDRRLYVATHKGEIRCYPNPGAQADQFQTLAFPPGIMPLRLIAPSQGAGCLLVASQQRYLIEPAVKN
jgi:hypothetical protein